MVRFSIHKAFSLIEATIAIAIVGIVLVAAFGLQQTVLLTSFDRANLLRQVVLIKNALYDSEFLRGLSDGKDKIEQRDKNLQTTVVVERIQGGSKIFADKQLEQFIAKSRWDTAFGIQEESLLLVRFKVPESKEQKNK